jgi:diguanylate cyclase (GGDEF)-like protein
MVDLRLMRTASLKTKLTLVNLVITGVALVLSSVLLVGIDYFRMRDALLEDLQVQAKMIGANSTAALMFRDSKTGREILSALSVSPNVTHASIVAQDGTLFAEYRRSGSADHVEPTALPPGTTHVFSAGMLALIQAIEQDGLAVGTLRIEADLSSLYHRLAWSSGVAVAIMISVLGIAFLLLLALRRALTRTEEHLDQLAHFDTVTNLPNRNMFNQQLAHALAQARRNSRNVGLLFLDLDRFKIINDTLGHHVGDLLLRAVAARLVNAMREADTVCRLGGDEFIVVVENAATPAAMATIAEHVISEFSRPFQIESHEIYISPSIGISVYPNDGKNSDLLLKHADIAMYHAKEQGRNNFQFFSVDMNQRAKHRLSMETNLRRGLEREEFQLHYQPKVDIASGRIVGVEALIRWQHPEHGAVSPAEFIPIAEDTGLILPIGEWVLRTACAQAKAWDHAGYGPLRMAVNLSGRQFAKGDVVEMISRILDNARLPAEHLELEITESVLMETTEATAAKLTQLRAMGIQVAIDDFGTGYSSMTYLKRFPISTLKIDRSFVRDIPGDTDDAAITTAIIAMAHSLKIGVVAEGVETGEQVKFLRDHGCTYAQGFYFSKPLPAEELVLLLIAQVVPKFVEALY